LTQNCTGNQGAGPFKFVCNGNRFFPAGQTPVYTLVPNPYYYGNKPDIKVSLPGISTVDLAYKMYGAGQLDTTPVPTAYINRWQGKPELLTFPTSVVTYLSPNTQTAPFSDVHCRLAVAYAIDRNTIAKGILHGATRPFYGVVPEGMLGFLGNEGVPSYNVSKAKAEFAQCPYKTTPVVIKYPTGSQDADATYLAVAHMLNEVGFNATTKPMLANQWYEAVSQPLSSTDTQIIRNGWQQDYPDPQDYVTLLLQSQSNYDIGGWKSTKFDEIVSQADVAGRDAVRARLYKQAERIALNDGAWIALTNALGHQLISTKVHGLVGTSAFGDIVPQGGDWSNVTIS
jgi:ABC-type oligopeptide transport system substrate-binding subunit